MRLCHAPCCRPDEMEANLKDTLLLLVVVVFAFHHLFHAALFSHNGTFFFAPFVWSCWLATAKTVQTSNFCSNLSRSFISILLLNITLLSEDFQSLCNDDSNMHHAPLFDIDDRTCAMSEDQRPKFCFCWTFYSLFVFFFSTMCFNLWYYIFFISKFVFFHLH